MTKFYLRNSFKYDDIIAFDFSLKQIRGPIEFTDEHKISGIFERIAGEIYAMVRPTMIGCSDVSDFFVIADNHYFFDDPTITADYKILEDNVNVFTLNKNCQLVKKVLHTPEYDWDPLGYALEENSSILFFINSHLAKYS